MPPSPATSTQTSPATQFLVPHAKSGGGPASAAHEPVHVQPPVLGSQTAPHLQLTGHAHGGGGPLHNGGGHGGEGGQIHWLLEQSGGVGPLHPKHGGGLPAQPFEPEVEPPDEELDTPDDEAPDDDAPEDDAPELEPPEDAPELEPPELDDEPGSGPTTVPPQATTRRVMAETAAARRDRFGRMLASRARAVPAMKPHQTRSFRRSGCAAWHRGAIGESGRGARGRRARGRCCMVNPMRRGVGAP